MQKKWYMSNQESILDYEMPKSLWNFELQAEQMTIHCDSKQNKRTYRIVDFAVAVDDRVKIKAVKREMST